MTTATRLRRRETGGPWVWLAAFILALGMAGAASARTVLDLDTTQQPVLLQDWGDLWLDTTGQRTAVQVRADPAIEWQPTRPGQIHPLRSGQALWVRFTIPPAPDAERWYLEVPAPSVNRVTLYTEDSAGQWVAQYAGDMLPVAKWPVPHRHPLLPVALSAEVPTHYLLRVENATGFSAPLRFISESALSRTEQRVSLLLGIYFGLTGLAVVLSVLSAVSLRDSAYALYAPAVAAMAFTQAAITGIGGLHLWPNQAGWNDVSVALLPPLTAGLMLLFIAAAVSLDERSARLHRIVLALALLCFAGAASTPLLPLDDRQQLAQPSVGLAQVVGLYVMFWAWRRGDRHAIWLFAGILPVALMATLPILRSQGVLAQSALTLHGMQIAHGLELPVVLVVLMLRSQQLRENTRRIRGLDRIDPATGLINEGVFTTRLARMIARSHRLRHQSAVLLVDVTNIDSLQRDFGRPSAQELPLRLAGRLLTTAREIDSVARLSDLRFGLLVEGPLTPKEAEGIAPRVVARCLMPFDDKPSGWVAQVRIASALVPMDGSNAEAVLTHLGAILAAVPEGSRRAVFTLGEARAQLAQAALNGDTRQGDWSD